jgi:hypothetical protein
MLASQRWCHVVMQGVMKQSSDQHDRPTEWIQHVAVYDA